jgi:carboxyl-terminal processing protease
MMHSKKLGAFIILLLTLISCSSDPINPEIEDPQIQDVSIQDFMWRAMNLWYYWQSEVPNLADSKRQNTLTYLEYLQENPDPKTFIESLLFEEDRFTFYADDYTELTNTLAGITKSNGLEFGLVLVAEGSDQVLMYTRYTIKGSDAELKGVQRGDLFNRVNGTVLTTANYADLLFSEADTYTLGKTALVDGSFIDLNEAITLTKEASLAEHPIYLDTIYQIEDKKIGYLMYNAFIGSYDTEVMNVFDRFQSNGVDELIVDLRYNSGGSTASARKIASRIYNAEPGTVFAKQDWNSKWNAAFGSSVVDTFDPVKGIGLSRVFILTETTSASASELLINGLDPHMQVIQIGDTTRGKNEFSITVVDDPQSPDFPYLYRAERVSQINPENSWALQPLVGRYENSVGFSEYTTGLVPDISQSESVLNMGTLGSLTEPLLAKAIEQITGVISTGREPYFEDLTGTPIEFKRPLMDASPQTTN